MAHQVEGEWVVPNPRVPQTFGTLNIIFGVLLLLYGAWGLAMVYFGPALQKEMERLFLGPIKEQQAARQAERDAKIADLKKKEAAAASKEEKAAIAGEREAMERGGEPDISKMTDDIMSLSTDRRIVAYTIVTNTTGIALNILMLASGIGLLKLSEWGRQLALGVAWLKIARWVVIVIFTMLVIVPITTEMTQKMFRTIDQQAKAKGAAAPPPMLIASLSQMAAVAAAVSTVITALIAITYPVLSLRFLTRPATRAAILAQSRLVAAPPVFEPGDVT